MNDNAEKKMTYEEALRLLEEIVRRLENEEIPLEESLSCFQEGVRLSRYCREKLAEIEYRVEYLLKEEQARREEQSETAMEKFAGDSEDD